MVPYSFRSVLLLLLLTAAMTAGVMDVEYSWIYADYTYGSLQQRESAIRSGKFIPENCVILDVDVFQGKSTLGGTEIGYPIIHHYYRRLPMKKKTNIERVSKRIGR